VHRGLRQIIANELGVTEPKLRAEFRKIVDERIQTAVTAWLEHHGISTVEQIVERVLSAKLARFRSESRDGFHKIVEAEVKKQVAEQVSSLLRDNLHLSVSAEIGGPKKRALDLK